MGTELRDMCKYAISRKITQREARVILLLDQYAELQIEKYSLALRIHSTKGDLLAEAKDVIDRIEQVLENLYKKDRSLLSISIEQ